MPRWERRSAGPVRSRASDGALDDLREALTENLNASQITPEVRHLGRVDQPTEAVQHEGWRHLHLPAPDDLSQLEQTILYGVFLQLRVESACDCAVHRTDAGACPQAQPDRPEVLLRSKHRSNVPCDVPEQRRARLASRRIHAGGVPRLRPQALRLPAELLALPSGPPRRLQLLGATPGDRRLRSLGRRRHRSADEEYRDRACEQQLGHGLPPPVHRRFAVLDPTRRRRLV